MGPDDTALDSMMPAGVPPPPPGFFPVRAKSALPAGIPPPPPGFSPVDPTFAPNPNEDKNKNPTAGAANRFVSGAISTLNPMPLIEKYGREGAGGVLGSAVQAQADEFHKAGDALHSRGEFEGQSLPNRLSQAAGHAVAGALPVVGPAAANVGEELGTALADPNGDVATPLGKGFGLVAPAIAAGGASLAGKVADATGATDAIAGGLRNSASDSYSRVLNPTTKANKAITQRIAPELADRGVVAFSRKGIQNQAAANIQKFGQQISDAYDALPPNATVPLDSIVQHMDKAAGDSFTIPDANGVEVPMGPLAKQGLSHVEDLKDALASVAQRDPSTGEMVIPVDKVRKLRQYTDGVAAMANRYAGAQLADESQAAAHGMAADAMRAELAQRFPDINKLNQEYSFWKDVHKVVSDTINRKTGQAPPLGEQLAGAAGAAAGFTKAGPKGAILGAEASRGLVKLFRSPSWNTISASTKSVLADMIASGNTGGVASFVKTAMTRPEVYRIAESPALVGNIPSIFPLAKLGEFAQQNGMAPETARQQLLADGWHIQ